MSNLSYNQGEAKLQKIMEDKGIEFLVDSLKHFAQKEKTDLVDPAIDSLTHMSELKPSLGYIE